MPGVHRCVARFDHHCAWINNCVGLLNLKYFLGFLAANVILTTYGECICQCFPDKLRCPLVLHPNPAPYSVILT